MKFQMLNEEGNLETFERITEVGKTRDLCIKIRESTIEQCAQIALDIAMELRGEADGLRRTENDTYLRNEDHQADTAIEIARRIRALAGSPAQPSRNIIQEQAVISALVEACEIAEETISHVHDDFPECYQKLQDALALANTLKKGEVK